MKKNDEAAFPAKKTDQSQADQHARFLETARQLGCDEDEAAFDEKLKAIAKAKPKEPLSNAQDPSAKPD